MVHNSTVYAFCLIAMLFASLANVSQAQFVEKGIYDEGLKTAIIEKCNENVQANDLSLRVADSTLDVQSYELWMDWYALLKADTMSANGRQCDAHIRITVAARADRPTLDLHAVSLAIDSAVMNGKRLPLQTASSTVSLSIPDGITKDSVYTIDIWYAPLQRRNGFYAFTPKEIDTAGTVTTNLIYTFTEPTGSRYWFPCFDEPHDKALFTFHGRVPSGYTVVSNGRLVDSIPDGDTAAWQQWHCSDPMPTYLFVANASQFVCLEQEVVSIDGRTLPLRNYCWAQDLEGARYNARSTFANLPRMITAFEKLFGRFPFESYGHTAVAPITIGGMEHQTMTTVARRWLQGDLEFAVAHELGHQWTGDQITCGTWSDLWMNEGGAAWSEALWSREIGGNEAYRAQMLSRRHTYLKSAALEPPVYNTPMGILFNEATTYCKAGWVYHMMYTMCGDEFLTVLQAWFATGPASRQTVEMREFLKQRIPNPVVSWDVFFDQWLAKPFHPNVGALLVTSHEQGSNTYQSTVSLTQLQALQGFNTVFEFPLHIQLSNGGSAFDTTIVVRNLSHSISVALPFEPTTCVLNPNDDILMQDSVIVLTSVPEQSDASLLRVISQMPVTTGSSVWLQTQAGSTLTAYSITGGILSTVQCSANQAMMSTNGWPTGLITLVQEDRNGTHSLSVICIN